MTYEIDTAMEKNLLGAGDKTAEALFRAKRRHLETGAITAEQYAMLVGWMGHVRISRGLSPRSGRNYVDGVFTFMRDMNADRKRVESVTAQDVEQWQQRLYLERRESSRTRNIRLVAVRQFYDWRERNGMGGNPARTVRGPKKPTTAARKYSTGQLRSIFDAIDRDKPEGVRDYALLLFFLATGARREEVAELDMQQMALKQRVGMVRLHGKGSKERTITFEGEAVYALQAWLAVRDPMELLDEEAVFISVAKGRHRGKRLKANGIYGVVKKYQKRSGIKVPENTALHVLRSTFATRLYDECGDIEVVRIAMGHDDINTTRRYIAISDRQLSTRISGGYLNEITGGKRDEEPGYLKELRRKHGFNKAA